MSPDTATTAADSPTQETGNVHLAGLDGGVVRIARAGVDDLAARVEGHVLFPGDASWDESVLIWNAMVARTPALVLQPKTAGDVATGIGFARDHGLLLSIKGGGHNIAGTSLAEGGLTLDMSLMCDVTVDPEARLVHVGSGCRLRDVDRATQQHGLATVLGFISEVGVAGLTLGGGFGYLMRRFGWAVDNLEEVQIVTADGKVRIASRAQHPELFWAIRGGGGNFGVVTRFTYRLHEVGPTVTGGLVLYDAAMADEVLGVYRGLTESAPRELAAALVIRLAPPAPFIPEPWHGKPVIGMLVCHSGTSPESDLAPVRALPDPIVDLITRKPYIEQQSMMDGTEPKGHHYYWKTEYLSALTDGFLAAFRDGALKVPSVCSESVIFHLGGASNEHAEDDGAVGNRDAHYVTGFAGASPPDGNPDVQVGWVRDAWDAIRTFSTGGNYVNFQLAEDDTTRTAAAYRSNYERLEHVKSRFDPHNLFRVNRNIAPHRVEGG
jgi:hypothetical protein